uniref:Uncharacterized protein n=1 Tax=Onchocerca volvulus TaxID=6282 RepID=A0A8R1TZT3_ONCVO
MYMDNNKNFGQFFISESIREISSRIFEKLSEKEYFMQSDFYMPKHNVRNFDLNLLLEYLNLLLEYSIHIASITEIDGIQECKISARIKNRMHACMQVHVFFLENGITLHCMHYPTIQSSYYCFDEKKYICILCEFCIPWKVPSESTEFRIHNNVRNRKSYLAGLQFPSNRILPDCNFQSCLTG